MMAELVVVQSCGFVGVREEKSGGQLSEAGEDWRPASRQATSQAYLETSLDDLSYSSDDNSSTTAATTPASSITPEPNNRITDYKPNHFLPNDLRRHHNNTNAEPGSRQSADDAVERRLMEQIQSEQEALQQQQQPANHQLLIMQNHHRQQHQHQQREAEQCQQVASSPHEPAPSSFQRRTQQLQQQSRQRYNTFGRPLPEPSSLDLATNEHPPAVPVRRSSQLASRHTQANEQASGDLHRGPTRNGQQATSFRRPARSPPPPPPGHHNNTTLPAAAPKQAQQQARLCSMRPSRRLWSPPSSSSGGISPAALSVSDESSLNNLNALASNSTGEAARTLADCSTPTPQSTVVEGKAQRRLNQLNDEPPQVVGAGNGEQARVSPSAVDIAEETQLDESGLSGGAPPFALSGEASRVPPLKQKPVVGASESCNNRLRSRSVVSELQTPLAGLTNEQPSSTESGASHGSLHQPQQHQQPGIMRSFSIAAPPCLASDSQMQLLQGNQRQLVDRQQQAELESECEHSIVEEKHLQMEQSGACKYWTLPSPGTRSHQTQATKDAQLIGYAVVERGERKSSYTGKTAQPSSSAADQLLASKSGPHTDTTCQDDNKQNNAIASRPEENPFPVGLCDSCSPQAATCANLCRFSADPTAPADLAIALMPSQHHNHHEQQPMSRMGDARHQQHPLQPATSSRLQDEWLRSMYKQMHRPSAENRHLKALNSAQQQQHHQELPIRIQLKGEAPTAYPPPYSPTSESDSFNVPCNRRSRPSESPQASSGTVSDHLSGETSHERNLSLYYKLIKHIDHAFSSVLTDVNSRSSHTLQAPRRSRSTKLQRNTSKSGPQTPVAGRSSNDQSSSIRVGSGYLWPQMSSHEQHERRCVFSQLLKDDHLTTTTTTTKLPLKDTCDLLIDEADQHKQYLAVQAGCDIPLKGLRKPAPPASIHKDHMFSDESVHIHYRTPTGKLLKMNTLNEFELNRLKKLYGKQVASGCPIERSKSSWLSSAHPASGSSRQCKGGRDAGPGEDTLVSPFVDLHRYQRAFLLAARNGNRGFSTPASNGYSGTQSIRFGRALFDFQAKSSGELSLRRGDLVELIELVDHTWAKVEDCQSGLRGLAPLNYIDYNVGCAVAKRNVSRHRGSARLDSTAANEPPYEQHLLPMSKGEPITLIRRLSGHLYEASNTRQALGLVWSRDLDIIKQPVLGPETSPLATQTNSYYSAATQQAFEQEQIQDDEEEMLILESDEQFLAKRRRARSASGRPSTSVSSQLKQDCSCSKDYCISSSRPDLPQGRPPRRSSSSPFISNQLQQPPVSPTRARKLPQVYRAKYAYQPRQRDELELVAGDLLLVMHTCDDGWYIGTSYSTNQMGTFPGNFVEPVE